MRTERNNSFFVLLLTLLLTATALDAKEGRYGKWRAQTTEKESVATDTEGGAEPKGQVKTQLEIRVSDEKGNPIKGARVMVVYRNKNESERSTNRRGIAQLRDLPQGQVDVDVTSPGRLSASKRAMLDEKPVTLLFTLKPRTPAEDQHE